MRCINAVFGLLTVVGTSALEAQSLRGSHAAMERQFTIAQQQDYTFLRTSGDVQRFVDTGLLVPLRGNADYVVERVSFPYARSAVKLFVERLAAQYRAVCGERLVVTSLTRPLSRQPRNSHELSVHPTGMAADLRVSKRSSCRRWLESTLSQLEASNVLEATKERRPAHYHVAIFPSAYSRHVASLTGTPDHRIASASTNALKIDPAPAAPQHASVLTVSAAPRSVETYTVRRGDSLWTIARKFDTSVAALKEANHLIRSIIRPGQRLTIPGAAVAAADDGGQ
jgi:LysM repeat protein